MPHRLLVAIGALALSGASCLGASWFCNLSIQDRAHMIGQVLAAWFCCGPFVGIAGGWALHQWLRPSGHSFSRSEEL